MTATPTGTPPTDLSEVTPEEAALTGHAYAAARPDASPPRGTLSGDRKSVTEQVLLALFVFVPLVAVVVAVPFAWGWGLTWVDVGLSVVFFAIAALGITVGFHRYFTHHSFKANRPLRIALAVAGMYAIEGPVVRWVADHRKHHAFSDAEGDPHSPWRYGEGPRALLKGLWWAHTGWLFDVEQTPQEKYAPDLLNDPEIRRLSRLFPWFVTGSLLLPALLGGLLTWSWWGALTAFFWASLVRVALVHHVTWSINSVCHVWGTHPFKTRDRSGNVKWLAPLSAGESFHNLHHADPTCARHGVLRWEWDISARLIELFEWFGWASDVRWPREARLRAKAAGDPDALRFHGKMLP